MISRFVMAALVSAMCMAPLARAQVGLEVSPVLSGDVRDGLECVDGALSPEFRDVVVEAYFSKDSAAGENVAVVLTRAAEICKVEFGFNDEQTTLSVGYAQNSAIVAGLTRDVVGDGMKDAGTIEGVWGAMAAVDRARLLDPRWRVNPVFRAQTEMALVEAGVPNKLEVMTDALIVLEATSHVAAATRRWLELAGE